MLTLLSRPGWDGLDQKPKFFMWGPFNAEKRCGARGGKKKVKINRHSELLKNSAAYCIVILSQWKHFEPCRIWLLPDNEADCIFNGRANPWRTHGTLFGWIIARWESYFWRKKDPVKISDRRDRLPAVLTGRTQHLHFHNRGAEPRQTCRAPMFKHNWLNDIQAIIKGKLALRVSAFDVLWSFLLRITLRSLFVWKSTLAPKRVCSWSCRESC